MAEEKAPTLTASESESGGEKGTTVEKKHPGVISRIWKRLFGARSDDFEKRLHHISKEEAAVITRIKNRSITSRNITRYLILFSFVLEVIAIVYAIMTTRTVDLDWKIRAARVLPMFLLPCFSTLAYSGFVNFTRMCDSKDQKNLERLRAERQEKIDELKERTNYYITQQLIQKYDTDPAAKAAAATILASKLGADSGLKVFVGDKSNLNITAGKSNNFELAHSSGLRNRKQVQARLTSTAGNTGYSAEELARSVQDEILQSHETSQLIVEHHNPQASSAYDGGWLSRLAALLVGEDPRQSYALICGNCHMHNGLAQKEDFPFITYYCPHCHALNQPKQLPGQTSGSNACDLAHLITERTTSGSPSESVLTVNSPIKTGLEDDSVAGNSPVKTGTENEEAGENIASEAATS